MMIEFCTVLAFFGAFFLALFGYFVQTEMPYLKFKMDDRQKTQQSLYISAIIYAIIAILFSTYMCCRKKQVPIYRIYNPKKIY